MYFANGPSRIKRPEAYTIMLLLSFMSRIKSHEKPRSKKEILPPAEGEIASLAPRLRALITQERKKTLDPGLHCGRNVMCELAQLMIEHSAGQAAPTRGQVDTWKRYPNLELSLAMDVALHSLVEMQCYI
ncbi:hypothetical protein AC579_2465 [Pseudocercospora musae]|uniref:Uncharacterized protein n=1 Tax=Pseudocercospora musae TaxID=113226 RepID=A0A139IHK9_9PEZI|nr:hypothetical protein AC579_2465 [Pseudocercospora musae]